MPPERPLPMEALLPFGERRVSTELSNIRSASLDHSRRDDQSPDSLEEADHSGNETEKPKRHKRSRACIACRNMKIRCLPIDGQEACSSCSKVNRECIMPGPPRKRQKTVHKVAELEKKINALTDALLAKGQQADSTPTDSSENQQTTRSTSEPAKTDATSVVEDHMTDHYERNFINQAFPPSKMSQGNTASCVPPYVEAHPNETYIDVIERGDLTIEVATSMFQYWLQTMCATSPLIGFPLGTEMKDIRSRRPMLFLAIMTITSPIIKPAAQPALIVELNRQLSERVLFHGEKSLDMIQALMMNCQYYMRPRNARDMSFNQSVHCAAIMGLELGIGKRSSGDRGRSPIEGLELRRTWLACYQLSSVVTTLLRLPSVLKYSTHIEECLQYVKASPFAQPSDKWLCALVRMQRLLEEVAVAFDMDDPAGKVVFLEAKIQYQLKSFERQLAMWKEETDVVPVEKGVVEHTVACATLYIHEIALHVEHNVDDFRPGVFPTNSSKPLDFVTSGHIDALTVILHACHKVLDLYISFDVEFARSLPNVVIVWTTYASVVLVKLHGFVHDPMSKFGSIFLADLKTEYYLDTMLRKLAEVADGGHGPCAEAFGFVYRKLKMWHMHRAGRFTDDERTPDEQELQRRQAASILRSSPASIMHSTKDSNLQAMDAQQLRNEARSAMMPNLQAEKPILTSDLNAAYDAASYGNTNWDQFNFSVEELNMFDLYMNNASGWMGYLI